MGYKRVPEPPARIIPFMRKDSWQLAVGSLQFLKTLQSSYLVFIEFINPISIAEISFVSVIQ